MLCTAFDARCAAAGQLMVVLGGKMNQRVDDEGNRVWFRMDRLFSVGNEWYVATREGQDIGPFKSRVAAKSSLERYLLNIRDKKTRGLNAKKVALEGMWATNNFI